MSTVGKFNDFSITQILREFNFGDSRSAKSVILTHLEAIKFDLNEFLHYLKAGVNKLTKFRDPEMTKMAYLELLYSPNLISRKI